MASRNDFKILCFLLYWFGAQASHFRGAIFTWKPTDVQNQVEISWRISWRRSSGVHHCDQTNIDNGVLTSGEGDLDCHAGCSGTIARLSYYCTDFSVSEDWTSGQYTHFLYTSPVPVFQVRFDGCCWITLNYGGGGWSLVASINLAPREDIGKPNSSPLSAITPIVRLQHGCNHTLTIPVTDPDGDIVRCRWASGDIECADVCNVLPHAYLDTNACKLHYEAIYETGWFAVALMVEDFNDSLSTTPLSKIPIQFLINVYANSGPCGSAPVFVNPTPKDGSCVGIPPNETYFQQLIAMTGSDDVSITAIETVSPIGMVKSPVGYLKARHYYVNITWTPNFESQYGENIFCFTAEDSLGLSSSQQCITLVVGVAPPTIEIETIQPPPNSVILSGNSVWRLQYDIEYERPSRSTFITYYDYNGNEVYSVDASVSSSVSYLPGRVLLISTPVTLKLQEKQEYYILMESGVAKGFEFCGPESPPIWDQFFWRFSIRDTTAPILRFTKAPQFSNDEITIRWTYNEPVNSTCTLQVPDQTISFVECDLSWNSMNLTEGYHSIFVTGTDYSGNIGATEIHSWVADLTAPSANIITKPPFSSNELEATFTFGCNESPCTFECALEVKGDSPEFVSCNTGSYTESGLSGYVDYQFFVMATDRVNNTGLPVNYTWQIDIAPPVISPLPNLDLSCGDDFSPDITGIPNVTDTQDPDPALSYRDNPTNGCILQRVWTATDSAGNTASVTQTITFSSPQPPELNLPVSVLLACGDPTEDDRTAEDLVNEGLLHHPCNRSMVANYHDSTQQKKCGLTFTRTWTVTDDCNGVVYTMQTIMILELVMPEQPQNNQVSVDLDIVLEWPPYPGTIKHNLYVWMDGEGKPKTPKYVTTGHKYQSSQPYAPNTRYFWQVDYILNSESGDLLNTSVVPSPVWTFVTRTYADFVVTDVDVPSGAFSGKDLTVSWTVENIGSRGSGVPSWYDEVYLSTAPDFTSLTLVARQVESQFLDPNDGYMASVTVRLQEDRIGLYYVYVKTDTRNHVDDYDKSNNIGRSNGPVDIRLTPPPDLVVTSIIVPDNTFSGRNIEVKYTVKNLGTGVTASSTWKDAVYWSADNTTDSRDTLLATVTYGGSDGLQPNTGYTVTQTISVPRYIDGNYWVFVEADYGHNVFEFVDEDNNKAGTESPIRVTLDPPPDLAVTAFDIPPAAESTDTILVTWTVINEGSMTPYEKYWRDLVNIRKNDGSSSRTITTQSFSGDLAVDQTYSRSHVYVIPPELSDGTYNVTLYVDYYSQVFEYTFLANNMEVSQIQIRQKLPDFIIDFANATTILDQENGKTHMKLHWLVRNIGQGRPGRSEWIDRVHISDTEQNLDILGNIAHQLGDPNEEEPGFPSDSSYLAIGLFDVQIYFQGEVQLSIHTDYGNNVLEENDETSSNLYIISAHLPARSSDVRVDSIEITVDGELREDLLAGQIVRVIWNVVNDGNWPTSTSSWIDSVYISREDVLDESAERLADLKHNGELSLHESYEAGVDVLIPDEIWGTFNFIVKVDDRNDLWQSGEADNKMRSQFVYIEIPPYPVLMVTYISYSISWANELQQQKEDNTRFLSVSWSVNNVGNSMVRPFEWDDAVIVSEKEGVITPPEASLLGTFTRSGELSASQIYNITKTVLVPESLGGTNFSVYVVPDYYKAVPTSEEPPLYEDTPPVYIPIIPKPDLEVSYESGVPSQVFSGEQIDVVFRGHNIGAPTTESSWIDAIYLDPMPSLEETSPSPAALLVQEITHVGALSSGETYAVRIYFQVPYFANGFYGVLIELNAFKDLEEDSYENNIIRVPTTMFVKPSPLPDLITSISKTYCDPNFRSGEPFAFQFNISNVGKGALPNVPFFNSIYLSSDVKLDSFDFKFASFALGIPLKPNETDTIEVKPFLPYDIIPADYYLLLHVDSRDDIYEIDEENNIDNVIMCIEEQSTADIVVLDVIAPPSPVKYLDEVTINWKLVNNGSETAIGYQCDTVYFSKDQHWAIEDDEIGTECVDINLPPLNEPGIPYELSSTLPLLTPMNYNAIVRSRSNIRDLNLQNNIGVSKETTTVDMDILNIRQPNIVTLELNKDKVFRVPDVAAEETLLFRMESDTATDFNELYVQHGEVVTTGNYDAAGQEFLAANQEVAIAKSKTGDYFVLIRKTGTSASSESTTYTSQITLSVKYAALEILSVSPREVAPLGMVTLHIYGTLLPEEAFISLESLDGGLNITADDIYHFTTLDIYATFNLTNASILSNFTLHITDQYNPDEEAVLPNALRVIDGRPGTVRFRFTYPSNLLVRQTGQVLLFVENIGDTDVLTPMLSLELYGEAELQILYGSRSVNWTTGHIVYAVPDEGPGGILPPGGTSTVVFNVRPNSGTSMSVSLTVSQLPASENIPHPYQNRTLLKPEKMDDMAWEPVWENFMAAVGKTQSSLSRQLSCTANQLSLIGRRIVDMSEMIQHQLRLADDFLSGNDLYYEKDLSFGSQDRGFHQAEVTRYFPTRISLRNFLGLFGRGWRSPYWDTKLTEVTLTQAVLKIGSDPFLFARSYNSANRTIYELPLVGRIEIFDDEIVYIDETVSVITVYHFDKESYQLLLITNDFDNSTLRFVYNSVTKELKTITSSMGFVISLEYNIKGLIDAITLVSEDGQSQASRYTYDNTYDYLISVETPDQTFTYSYTQEGALGSMQKSDGSGIEFLFNEVSFYAGAIWYNEYGDLTSKVTVHNDGVGKIVLYMEQANESSYYIFDENANIGYVKELGLLSTRFIRNYETGSKTTYVGDLILIKEEYDESSEILEVYDANGDAIVLGIKPDGIVKFLEDGEGNVRTAEYDDDDLLRNLTFPDQTKEEYWYKTSTQIEQFKNRAGDVINYEWDGNGNVVTKILPNGETSHYLYDRQGLIIEASNNVGKILFSYNDDGTPSAVHYSNGRELQYQYDHKSRRVGLYDNNGYNISYLYNKKGEMYEVRDNNQDGLKLLIVDYDAQGRVIQRTNANGCSTKVKYDQRFRRQQELTTSCLHDSSNTILTTKYDFDQRNRIKSRNSSNGIWRYSYDSASQLTSWIDPNGTETRITYDKARNRRVVSKEEIDTAYVVNNLNQYEQFGLDVEFYYDLNGGLVRIVDRGVGITERFSYSAEGKLVEITTPSESCSFLYDAMGNLYQKSCSGETTEYLVDPFGIFGEDIIAEITNATEKIYYVHAGLHGLVSMISSSENYSHFFHFDSAGSILGLTNSSGFLVNRYEYDPFGNIIYLKEQVANPYKFIGQWGVRKLQHVQGIYYMRARFYSALHGRFLTVDPLGIGGKAPNVYSYANNNPIENIDPKGTVVYALLIKTVSGAITNTVVYLATTGDEVTVSGIVSAAAYGAVSGLVGSIPGGKYAVKAAVGAAAGVAGYITKQKISGEEIDWTDLAQEALVGAVTNLFPTKPDLFGKPLKGFTQIKTMLKEFGKSVLSDILNGRHKAVINYRLSQFVSCLREAECRNELFEDLADFYTDIWDIIMNWIEAIDPNDIVGPAGYGAAKFVAATMKLPYKIRFENDVTATAPAQLVHIETTLDNNTDIRTFRVGNFGFGNFTKEVNPSGSFQETLDLVETLGLYVRVFAGVDITTGTVTWKLQAIDPETGQPPTDPLMGFLPPNPVNETTGQGFVTYTVKAMEGTNDLERIEAEATIIFDNNAPIATPSIFNTLDAGYPGVNLSVPEETLATGVLAVNLAPYDAASGVKFVNVYIETDTGRQIVEDGVTDNTVTLDLPIGCTYNIVAIATDNVGNTPSSSDIPPTDFFEIHFAELVYVCDLVNNCSGNGTCVAENFCVCFPDRYGHACDSNSPPVEPPVIGGTSAFGWEDTFINLTVTIRETDENDDAYTDVTIKDAPDEAFLNVGEKSGNDWIVPLESVPEMAISSSPNDDSDFVLIVIATTVRSSGRASRQFQYLCP